MTMINNDLFFTFIKIKYDYKNLLVCKYWYKNIIKHMKKKKEDFYDMKLYNAINNKYNYILYNNYDNIIVRAFDNIIHNIMKEIISDDDIKNSIMENIVENYKKLSIIITLYTITDIMKLGTNYVDNTEKCIAEEYAKILAKYYDYNIILT
jgi:hypothetical protein